MRPSVIILMLDALRADCAPRAVDSPHLRSLGLQPPQLEALSRLVEGSFAFTQAIACAPYTTACTASIFTGLLPPEHGLRSFSTTALSSEVRTLAAILGQAGYATCAMSDRPQVLQPMGLLRDFQTIVPGDDEALAWWDSYEVMPRFLFVHLWDVHKPYGMPAGRAYRSTYPALIQQWRERLRARGIPQPEQAGSPPGPAHAGGDREANAAQGSMLQGKTLDDDQERQLVYQMQYAWEDALGYRAGLEAYIEGLRTFDRGRLRDLAIALDARHTADRAITVVMADHGEGRDTPPSQRLCHGSTLLDDQLRIPLYIRIPGAGNGRPVGQQVSEADVAPTILDALGLLGERTAPRSPYNGRSLLPLMQGRADERPAYAEFWTLTHTPAAGDPQFHPDIASILRLRVLRYPQHKFYLAGQPFVLSDEHAGMSAEAFVRLAARHLLGRLERPEDAAAWLPVLQKAHGSENDKQQALIRQIESSAEYKSLHKYATYDLQRDPLELKPADARARPADWVAYQEQLGIMTEIDRCPRAGEPLLTNEADEQIILKRLQDLGYVE